MWCLQTVLLLGFLTHFTNQAECSSSSACPGLLDKMGDFLSPADGCVVLTGATGFVAGHIAEILLEKGYEVRGTVRDPSNEGKLAHLKALDARLPGTISFHKADLSSDDPFTEVAKGCVGMLHVASPAVFDAKDPEEAILKPAIAGTNSALRAAAAANMKSVVVTSSVSAVRPVQAKWDAEAAGEPVSKYTEEDWNDVATLDFGAYPTSKREAERAAHRFVEEQKPGFKFGTIHFPFAFGPQQNSRVTSSNNYISHLLLGEVPFVVPLCSDIVDVRDVAGAHVHVLENDVSGRFIVANDEEHFMYMSDIAASLKKNFPGFPIPSVTIPMPALEILAVVDDRISSYEVELARHCPGPRFDGSRLRDSGYVFQHTDVHETIREAGQSMIDFKVADGNRHLIPAAYVLIAIPFIVAGLLLWIISRCFFSGKKVKQN